MTPKGKERLLKLADILDVADAEHRKNKEPTYDQCTLIHADCGTPACALGHWAAANPRRFNYDAKGGSVRLRAYPDISGVDEIGSIEFDITEAQGTELFDYNGCGEARTSKEAARYIRNFVKRVENEQARALTAFAREQARKAVVFRKELEAGAVSSEEAECWA